MSRTVPLASGWPPLAADPTLLLLPTEPLRQDPQATAKQIRLIPDFLWHGPEPYGFRGDVWTCDRVAGVLYQEFGVWQQEPGAAPPSSVWAGPRKSRSPGRSSGTKRRSSAAGRSVACAEGEDTPSAPGPLFSWTSRASTSCPGWLRPTPHGGRRQSWTSGRRETICRSWAA